MSRLPLTLAKVRVPYSERFCGNYSGISVFQLYKCSATSPEKFADAAQI